MRKFKTHTGLAAPLDKANVDTDQIIPKQFLKAIVRSGLGAGLFFDWRFRHDGSEDPDFVLHHPHHRGASILVARHNFGSGSSREHAVWALDDFGFRVVIAPSFADIFRNNSMKNGLLPVILPAADVDHIFVMIGEHRGYNLTIDLDNQTVSDAYGWSAHFEIEPFAKECLLQGHDDIGLTLVHEGKISAHEAARPSPHRLPHRR
jgi:3-isopropylmalate/(R)-2-methylmalate dehydratase small subunit